MWNEYTLTYLFSIRSARTENNTHTTLKLCFLKFVFSMLYFTKPYTYSYYAPFAFIRLYSILFKTQLIV